MNVEKITRPSILKCRDYVPGKPVEEVRRELGLTDIIKMASNENPLGTSPKALAAIIEEMNSSCNRYPESLCVELRQRLSQLHKVNEAQIFIDNGLDGVITMLGLTFISPEDEIIFGDVTFPAYGNITRKMGGVCVEVPLTKDNRLDLDGFAKAITSKTKMVFVCNPNNPTGTIITAEELDKLLAVVPEDVLVIMDEAYFEFADDPGFPDSLIYLPKYKNMIVLRTFSKIMGLAALRIGYAIADESLIRVMLKAREPFPVNRAAQAGALASLDDHEFVEKTLQVNLSGRKQLTVGLSELGLTVYPSQTNFVYGELNGQDSKKIFEAMLHDGVIIRPQKASGRLDALRISIGTQEENTATLASLKKALDNYK
ncbi:MAG: histidinol-phosphate transaminase [Clostridiaceae bacterium]